MAFQFQCPQCAGLMQAEDFQAGQQSYCPLCGALFLIPSPFVAPATPQAPLAPHGPAAFPPRPTSGYPQVDATLPPSYPQIGAAPTPGFPQLGPAPAPPTSGFPVVGPGAGTPAGAPSTKPAGPSFELREPDLLHIPCPQCKKMLETPVEMLDQEVLCPHCQAQFQLRRRDSVEFKRKKQQEAEIKEFKAGRTWLNLAIVAVVLVVLFLGALLVWDVFGN